MARKKRADMTPMERMEYIMKDATLDDGEAVGIEILARCMALHVYAFEEGEGYCQQLMERICKRADKWAHEPGSPTILAFAAAGYKILQGEYQLKSGVTNKKESRL